MDSVGGEVGWEASGLGDMGVVEVDVGHSFFLSESFQSDVQALNERSRVYFPSPGV